MLENHVDIVRAMIHAIGEDVGREGLRDTPERVARSWGELFAGYKQVPGQILGTTFSADTYDQMIVVKDIRFFSFCEHHMLPFHGVVHVGYLPRERVVGLSKIPRLVECYARRLQIQERMTEQIATAMFEVLNPAGVGVVVEGVHTCMVARGVKKEGATMLTSSLRGNFKDANVRGEFLRLIGK